MFEVKNPPPLLGTALCRDPFFYKKDEKKEEGQKRQKGKETKGGSLSGVFLQSEPLRDKNMKLSPQNM